MKRTLNFALILLSFLLWTNQASAYSFIGTANDSQSLSTTGFFAGYDGTFGIQSDYGSTAPVSVQLDLSFDLTARNYAQANARWNTNAPGSVVPSWYALNDQYNLFSGTLGNISTYSQDLLFNFNLTPGTLYNWHMDVEVYLGEGGFGSAEISYDFRDLPTETPNGAAPVPEPSTIVLLGFGVGIVATARKWFHK